MLGWSRPARISPLRPEAPQDEVRVHAAADELDRGPPARTLRRDAGRDRRCPCRRARARARSPRVRCATGARRPRTAPSTICSTAGTSRNSPAAVARREQRAHLRREGRVAAGTRGRASGPAPADRARTPRSKRSRTSLPALRRHARSSSRKSQAFAERKSRLTEDGEVSRTSAVSSIVRPPKKRSSTICACAPSSALSRVEGLVERQDVDLARRLGRGDGDVQRHLLDLAAPLLGAAAAGVVDQDPAHRLRGDREEVTAVLPGDPRLIDEPEVRLVHDRGRLQRVAGRLLPEVPFGDAAAARRRRAASASRAPPDRPCSRRAGAG